MKELFLVRHGKSSWKEAEVHDKERPLSIRGVEEVYKLAEDFKERGYYPELVITSSATRAWQTARILAEGFEYPVSRINVSDWLYSCTKNELFDELRKVSNQIDSVLIVGHDPSLTNFVNLFMRYPLEKIKASGFVHIQFESNDWSILTQNPSKVIRTHLVKR